MDHPRPVSFIVDELPWDAYHGQLNAYDSENMAAAYQPVVEAIVGSPINKAGRVEYVHVNLRSNRWYEIVAPRADFFKNLTQGGFERMVRVMLDTGSFRDPETDELIWQLVPDIPNSFPRDHDTHFVGCYSGDDEDEDEEVILYRDFISNTLNDHSYVFVVGRFATGCMEEFITEKIKVSSYSLTPEVCLYRVCDELENKWGVN